MSTDDDKCWSRCRSGVYFAGRSYCCKMLRIIWFLWLLFDYPFCECLKDVAIDVPVAVTPGDTVKMRCLYDLENESLYTVKWYKGRQEFYRYVPKELPHTRVFPLPGVNVDVSLSGSNEVVLRDVQKDLAGKYRCEVSADAPSFHTQVVSSHMNVVYAPDGVPNLMLEKSQYSIGDTLKGNCTSPPSVPSANITWYINGKQMNATFVNRTKLTQKELDVNVTDSFPELWVTKAGIQFEVNTFQGSQLRILCIADLFHVYSSKTEIVLTEERPKLASILYTRNTASYGRVKLSQHHFLDVLVIAFICCVVGLCS